MNKIGNIINKFRTMSAMTRKDLAKQICSEKYVYLIEKGERTPSADIVRLFGERLGIDLFAYYPYLDCKDPAAVWGMIKDFNMHRRKSDFTALREATDRAIELPDFHRKPWIYEIAINRLAYEIFIERKYQAAIADLNHIIYRTDNQYIGDINLVNLYILSASCFQLIGDLANAKTMVLAADEILRPHGNIKRNEEITTTVKISTMTLHYLSGEFDAVIREGSDLLVYQQEINSYERIHYTFVYLAFAYYKIGAYHEASAFFKKAIYFLLIEDKPMDVYYISAQDLFEVLLNDGKINREMVGEFKNKYGLL